MADLAGSLVTICDYIFEKLEANQANLGVAQVYYGDQEKFPETPSVCVEPDERPRELKSAQRMTKVTFRIYILVYHGTISSPQANRRDADLLAENIEALIHEDPQFGGLLIHSLCTNIESGYANRGERTLVRTSRITFEGLSQQLLPSTS